MSKTTPDHYGGAGNPYEAIKVIEAWGLGFCLGNAVKYLCRAGKKQGESACDDLEKAAWYVDREIKAAGGEPAALAEWAVKGAHEVLRRHDAIVTAKDAEIAGLEARVLSAQNELALYREAVGKPTPSILDLFETALGWRPERIELRGGTTERYRNFGAIPEGLAFCSGETSTARGGAYHVSAVFTPATMAEPPRPVEREEIAEQPQTLDVVLVPGWVEGQARSMLTERVTTGIGAPLDLSKQIGLTLEFTAYGTLRVTQHREHPAGNLATAEHSSLASETEQVLQPHPVTDEERRTVETAKALSKPRADRSGSRSERLVGADRIVGVWQSQPPTS